MAAILLSLFGNLTQTNSESRNGFYFSPNDSVDRIYNLTVFSTSGEFPRLLVEQCALQSEYDYWSLLTLPTVTESVIS